MDNNQDVEVHQSIVKWQGVVIAVVVVLTLFLVNRAIWDKEQHLAYGQQVLLKMKPVDPRSLMQGDYMRIRFAIEDDIKQYFGNNQFVDGFAVLRLDEHDIGQFDGVAHIDAAQKPSEKGLINVRFRIRNGQVNFATSSFFFQEGKAAYYEKAEYGVFRVNQQGEPLLTDLVVGP